MSQVKVVVYAVEALVPEQVVEDAWSTSLREAPRRTNACWVVHARLEPAGKVHVTVPVAMYEKYNS